MLRYYITDRGPLGGCEALLESIARAHGGGRRTHPDPREGSDRTRTDGWCAGAATAESARRGHPGECARGYRAGVWRAGRTSAGGSIAAAEWRRYCSVRFLIGAPATRWRKFGARKAKGRISWCWDRSSSRPRKPHTAPRWDWIVCAKPPLRADAGAGAGRSNDGERAVLPGSGRGRYRRHLHVPGVSRLSGPGGPAALRRTAWVCEHRIRSDYVCRIR